MKKVWRLSHRVLFGSGCGLRCSEGPVDLVFVVDSSEAVGPENLELLKYFVNALLERVPFGGESGHVGVLQFGRVSVVVLGLQRLDDRTVAKAAVRKMPYLGEAAYVGEAIRSAGRLLGAGRPGVKKVAVVMTAGRSDPRDVAELAAEEARRDGIQILVIGVANQNESSPDQLTSQMKSITSNREHVHIVQSFSNLHSR